RGHCFVRYADDCNVYVHSRRAGERVMELLRRLYARLRLKVNETKSAVANAFANRKFLGYSFWRHQGQVKRAVAASRVIMSSAELFAAFAETPRSQKALERARRARKQVPYRLHDCFGLRRTPSRQQRFHNCCLPAGPCL